MGLGLLLSLFCGTRVVMIFMRGQQPLLVGGHHRDYRGVSLIFRQRLARVPGVVGEVSASQPNRRLHHELATTAKDVVGRDGPRTPAEMRLPTQRLFEFPNRAVQPPAYMPRRTCTLGRRSPEREFSPNYPSSPTTRMSSFRPSRHDLGYRKLKEESSAWS